MTTDNQGRPQVLLIALVTLTLIGAITLVLSIANAVAISNTADQREVERIEADVEACERENNLRRRVIEVGEATDNLVSHILADVEAAERFAEPLSQYRSRVQSIKIVDCPSITPGSTPEKETP